MNITLPDKIAKSADPEDDIYFKKLFDIIISVFMFLAFPT